MLFRVGTAYGMSGNNYFYTDNISAGQNNALCISGGFKGTIDTVQGSSSLSFSANGGSNFYALIGIYNKSTLNQLWVFKLSTSCLDFTERSCSDMQGNVWAAVTYGGTLDVDPSGTNAVNVPMYSTENCLFVKSTNSWPSYREAHSTIGNL
jgi:hypothetical protein